MRLSFLPGDLHLSNSASGFILTRRGAEVFHTHSERAAIMRFNRVKGEMEKNGVGATPPPNQTLPPVPEDSAPGAGDRRVRRSKPGRKQVARSAPVPRAGTSKLAAKGRSRTPDAGLAVASRLLVSAGVQQKLAELRAERDRISRAISALEALDGGGVSGGL